MSHRIACYTLFDITKTGVANRAKPGDDIINITEWYKKRNTQCNFDTILQIISLRSQPDVVKDPIIISIEFTDKCNFGYSFQDNKIHTVWTFDFEVQHSSVFEDGKSELGALYDACNQVPMIQTDTCHIKAGNTLNTDFDTRNIYFVKY